MKLFQQKKRKKHDTFLFAVCSTIQLPALCSWTYGNSSNILFRRGVICVFDFNLNLTLGSANRLSLLQPSFQGPILLFPRSVSLTFRRVREGPGNEVVFTPESNIKPSCNRVTNLVKILSNSPENCYWAMTAHE